MTARVVALVIALVASSARADEPVPEGPRIPIDLRKAYEDGDYEKVRSELLKAYALEPRTEFLFALGQVELNLGHYEAAIRYYEQFIARQPSEDQIALAQQAIGAARMRLAQHQEQEKQPLLPPPLPERPSVEQRAWHAEDTGLVGLGGAAMLVGAGLLFYSHRLGDDHSGTLADYDERVRQSRTTMWTGAGIATAGALVIGVTVLRWRW